VSADTDMTTPPYATAATPTATAPTAGMTSPAARQTAGLTATAMPTTAIATHGLTKRYGDVLAVDSLDLHVRRGEIYGFLGRNGAGKTTTIRMLLGLIRPSDGEVEVLGRRVRPGANDVFARVGYLVETATAYPNLTVRENLDIQRRLTGAPRAAVRQAIELMRLDGYADRRAGVLSLGNRQRLSLARALLHRPELLILDEPANALDPSGIVEIRRLLRSMAGEHGVTVLMSSHILAEVAHLADRIGVVHEGRLLEELDHDQLQARERLYVAVGVSEPERAATLLGEAGFARIERAGGRLRVFDAEERVAQIARTLIDAGIDLTELTPVHEDLESYFLRLTGDATAGAAGDVTGNAR
jgi:ABC-type multidrug transport system ATPase subunit